MEELLAQILGELKEINKKLDNASSYHSMDSIYDLINDGVSPMISNIEKKL